MASIAMLVYQRVDIPLDPQETCGLALPSEASTGEKLRPSCIGWSAGAHFWGKNHEEKMCV